MSEHVEGHDSPVPSLRERKGGAPTSDGSQIYLSKKRKRLLDGINDAEGHLQTPKGVPAQISALGGEASSSACSSGEQSLHAFSNSRQGHNEFCFLLDIFSGTAGVTAAFKRLGGEALGLDHVVDSKRTRGPISKVNLCNASSQKMVLQWLSDGKVDAVMLAPPCASRKKRIPSLRTSRWPNGVPNLKGVQRLKVTLANKLYKFTRKVIDFCVKLNIPFVCENPKRSLMWSTEFFLNLPSICRFQQIHACMYGGLRLKRLGLLLNFHAPNLLLECDTKHRHLPWGAPPPTNEKTARSAIHNEAEYPWDLCKELALAFQQELLRCGKQICPSGASMTAVHKIGVGLQPRGSAAPLLIQEFKTKISVQSCGVPVPSIITPDVCHPFQGIPVGAKLLSSRIEVQNKGEVGEKQVSISLFGLHRSPEEFLELAKGLQHPLDSPLRLESGNCKAIHAITEWKHSDVMSFRVEQLKKYTSLAQELQSEEKNIRHGMDEGVSAVLKGKRLALFKRMAEDAGVGDATLFDELISGFRLTGLMPESHQFPKKLKPALISVQQLKDSSIWAKRMIGASCRRVSSDMEIATAVYEETVQQLQDGWVVGPFTDKQLDEKYRGCWIPSKRFGVRQSGKIRAVDDFSEFLVNASVTATEKLTLYGLDEIVNTAKFFSGHAWCGAQSPFDASWLQVEGRALDLKSAYKQLARHPADAWASILAVWNPKSDSVEFYEGVALPFGSVCAVMAFNRMARALRIILSELFFLVNTNFFDDFCQLEVPALCKSAWDTAELVMKLLGWRISMSDDKRLPFSKSFNMLGAVVDFTEIHSGKILIRNKQSRLDDISALVNSILESSSIPSSLVETLKGRMLYAAGHTFGRCTHLATQLISRAARKGPMILVDDQLSSALAGALASLLNSKPRVVRSWSGNKPAVVFTDGACEEDGLKVTHGAVLYDGQTGKAQMFGDNVPSSWVELWRKSGRRQLICQAEIFPVIVAKATWSEILRGRSVIWFIDNNSALSARIRSFSPVIDNFSLLVINAQLDVEIDCLNWYARVPSPSNLGDAPSRLEFAKLEALGFQRCQPLYDFPHESMVQVGRKA